MPRSRLEYKESPGYTKTEEEIGNDQEHEEFIVVTEAGVIHEMEKCNPNKKFYLATDKLICSNMKKNTLEKIRDCLKNNTNQVNLDEEFMTKAKKPLIKMHELAK